VLEGQHHPRQHRGSHHILNRGSEPQRAYFRCGRYFTVGHEWYATVREGTEIGPFTTRNEAQMALANHVTACFIASCGHIGQIDAHGERDATMLEVLVQELASGREHARLRSENCAYIWAKQRLEEIDNHPEKFVHADVRVNALQYFLSELDR
jgi:hypothetical protein